MSDPNPQVRFLYRRIPVSEEEALRYRKEEEAHLQAQIHDLQGDLDRLRETPLPTERADYEEILPGDVRYAQADHGMNPTYWQGKWKWINPSQLGQ